ncbi:adh short domain containing protein [Trichuris trichiura]|uniref:Adh short domain containing protein n=1 Tax=Trichuris trichiura TaxID=36087 RepID=A0A077Z2T9_TRITR|nr:adh short domain containing protein [Trichuris trichiura]
MKLVLRMIVPSWFICILFSKFAYGVDINPVDPDHYIPNRFQGKTILITGGARGMGRAVAIRAAKEGANIVIADWLAEKGKETANEIIAIGGNAIALDINVSKTEDAERMVQEAVNAFGRIDYAVNAAGVTDGIYSGEPIDFKKHSHLITAPIHSATDDYWQRVIDVNAGGVFKSLRAELKQMIKQGQGGAIVNIASAVGIVGISYMPAYTASKHAINGLTKNAAIDYAKYGIRVNSVNMGNTDTDMLARINQVVKLLIENGMFNANLLKRGSLINHAHSKHPPSTVWEQASIILLLLSDEASSLTGGIYATDGGFTTY